MNKKKEPSNITDEERNLFRDTMSGIKPLKPITSVEHKKPKHTSKKTEKCAHTTHYTAEKQTNVSGDEQISFAKVGLQKKLLNQLRQGKLAISATLDLHRYTTQEATAATDDFLKTCQARGLRHVRIIHGKGYCSDTTSPSIKNLLNVYLRSHPLVLAFHSTQPKHGGAGALYVLIKSQGTCT